MGRDILIETVRDVEGKVVNAPLYAEPINLRKSTLFVGRCTRHLLVFYKVLIALRYPAVMHGQPDTVRELQSCLAEIEGPLTAVRQQLLALLNAQNASGVASEVYEMQFALNELLDYYLEINPGMTLARANREAFAKWLEKFYQPGKAEQGIIRLTTPHAGKDLEADDVYLINTSLFPMADKIEQGGEEAFQELCVEYVAKTRAKDRMVFLPDLEMTSKKEVLGLFVKLKVSSLDVAPVGTDTPSSSQSTEATEVEGESNTARDEALATLELTLMPATVEELDAHVVTLLRRAMKVRSAMRRETASPAVREEAERRKQAITGARNVLREGLRNAPLL